MPIAGVGEGRSIPGTNNERSSRSFLPRVLQRICNSSSVAEVPPASPVWSGAGGQPAATLRGMVEATFSSYGTADVQGRFEVCEGDACLRPLGASGGKRADAHASGLQHALNVGGGLARELMAGLANELAGGDLTTAGFVLQAANKRTHEGQEIDTRAVEKALKTVVEKLKDPKLARTGRGFYDGTRASKNVIDAFKKLKAESEKLIEQMGGIEWVLQDIAATQVHDRLVQQISERYPDTVGQHGEWLGMVDEQGHTLSPADFLHRGAAAQLQARCDTLSSLGTFDQLQWKSHELLKLVDLILDLEGPEDPPTQPKMPAKGADSSGPGPGANWNNNSSTGGSVTIMPGAFQSSGGSDAVMMEALKLIREMNDQKSQLLSEALQYIYNWRADANERSHTPAAPVPFVLTGGIPGPAAFPPGGDGDTASEVTSKTDGRGGHVSDPTPDLDAEQDFDIDVASTGRQGRFGALSSNQRDRALSDSSGVGSTGSHVQNPAPEEGDSQDSGGAVGPGIHDQFGGRSSNQRGRALSDSSGGSGMGSRVQSRALEEGNKQDFDGDAVGSGRQGRLDAGSGNQSDRVLSDKSGSSDTGSRVWNPASEEGNTQDSVDSVVGPGHPDRFGTRSSNQGDMALSHSSGNSHRQALEEAFRSLRAKREGEAEGHWTKFDNEKRLIYAGRVVDDRDPFWLGASMGRGTSPIDNRTRKKHTNIHQQFMSANATRPSSGETMSRQSGGSETPSVRRPLRGSMYQRFNSEPVEATEDPLDGLFHVTDSGM